MALAKQESTIGAAFFTQTVAVEGRSVKFEIWDTAGQERYHSLAPMYYRGAAAAIVVYDMTNPVSFPSLPFCFIYIIAVLFVENQPCIFSRINVISFFLIPIWLQFR